MNLIIIKVLKRKSGLLEEIAHGNRRRHQKSFTLNKIYGGSAAQSEIGLDGNSPLFCPFFRSEEDRSCPVGERGGIGGGDRSRPRAVENGLQVGHFLQRDVLADIV